MKKLKVLEGFAGVGAPMFALENLGFEISEDSKIIEWNIHSITMYAAVHHNEKYLQIKNEVLNNPDKYTKKELNNYFIENYSDKDGNPILSNDGKEPFTKYNIALDRAINLYAALNTVVNFGDISKATITEQDYDIFWHSSPCQSFSNSGNRDGGDEGSGTSSSLLYESVRIVKDITPRIVIWENVAGVLQSKHIHNFQNYLDELTKLGYSHTYAKIAGQDIGFVQNRPRVFAYSYLDEADAIDLNDILNKEYTPMSIEDVIDFSVDSKDMRFATSSVTRRNRDTSTAHFLETGHDLDKENFFFDAMLSPSRSAKSSPNSCPTLLTSMRIAKYSHITKNYSLLTSLEYWKLMGFPLSAYDLGVNEVLETQIYKICGNSVLVPVIEELFKLNKNL